MERPAGGEGWRWALVRLTLYVVLGLAFASLLALLVPEGIVGGSVALLGGSLAASGVLLARDGLGLPAAGLFLDRGSVREVALGTVLGVVVAGVAVAAIALAGGVRWTPQPGSAAGSATGFATGGATLLAALALPALAEEVALRGYLLQVAARGFGPWPALIGTSVLFSVMHGANPDIGIHGLIGIAAAGLALGAMVLRSGGLAWAVGAHLGWNWGLAWPADLAVSGLDLADTPGWDGEPAGPAWLSGGAFGPEASLVAAAVLGAGAWAVWRMRWPSRRPGRPIPLGAPETRGGGDGST